MSDTLRRWLPWVAVAIVAVIVIIIMAVNADSEPTITDAPDMRLHNGEIIECHFANEILVCDFSG